MSHYFPEFRGDDQSYDQTSAFLLDKFVGLNQNLDKSIYAVSPAQICSCQIEKRG
jgi:hypothetical protein